MYRTGLCQRRGGHWRISSQRQGRRGSSLHVWSEPRVIYIGWSWLLIKLKPNTSGFVVTLAQMHISSDLNLMFLLNLDLLKRTLVRCIPAQQRTCVSSFTSQRHWAKGSILPPSASASPPPRVQSQGPPPDELEPERSVVDGSKQNNSPLAPHPKV